MSNLLDQCDCCDYYTIPHGQDYEICPICFWEQDAYGIESPDDESGANHGLTLREGRCNFVRWGACAERFVSNVLPASERKNYRYAARNV
ncbi:CPCC family cysteine-rich protein [Massilia norwichensis]|uniref:CPCC family cysteine-rich protein n=1 Tax=Massilia norwichensis TaxID=1442366 RepID=UPI00351D409F